MSERYTVDITRYEEAQEVIRILEKNGIPARITEGGISIAAQDISDPAILSNAKIIIEELGFKLQVRNPTGATFPGEIKNRASKRAS